MGPLRASYVRREWGETIFGLMTRLKTLFDPDSVLNPGAIQPKASLADDLDPNILPRL